MFQNKKLVGALVRFIVIFGVLVIPWPGWNEFYSSYFRALGQDVFSRQEGQRVVLFEPLPIATRLFQPRLEDDAGQPLPGG